MITIDNLSAIALAIGAVLAVLSYAFLKTGRLRPEHLPLVFGLLGAVGALYIVVSPLLVRREPPTGSDLFWGISFGVVVYLSGRILTWRSRKP